MRSEFLIEHRGKTYVLYAGLLEEAHSRGLKSIATDLEQVPSKENGNVAIVKAVVEMEDGRIFSGIGDASPQNVGKGIAPHLIRMAETRGKARALRDAINVGVTAYEEISDGEPEASGDPEEHQKLLKQILEELASMSEEERPNQDDVLDFASNGLKEARKALARVRKIKAETEAKEAAG